MFAFDDQADEFGERAGLPAQTAASVARALQELVRPGPDDVILDVGAGTGEIGRALGSLGLRYVGLDRSRPMLETCHPQMTGRGCVLQADADSDWPLRDRSVRAIFCSRSAHLLSAEHLVAESMRVAQAGGHLVIGRIERPGSLHDEVRRQMRALVEPLVSSARGRRKEEASRRIGELCARAGAEPLPPRIAARMTATHSPREKIDAWRGKRGLAGVDLPQDVKDRVLADLERWAVHTYGSLDVRGSTEQLYVLDIHRLTAA